MRFLQMASNFGMPMLTGRPQIIFLNGQPYMLQECDPRDVYCNALDGFAPLDEGADGPHAWPEPYMVDPTETDAWLSNVGRGIY
eukprot:CAMPEP_0202811842 /NCGR_PEP_ID=MMETSP1389-20130828/3585_1 /ASSEMBLY_ACC=CAM_ASM_000865 /TAXON_ID=302021 /ORGANISM="Rhodomonas sp., Strain CCMP768" /LENGTH=83 /DNA_ID=CAMNT_0049483063 /DNA_START=14 /DNA_END=265 /DNA_ORIENTATION=-